MKNSSLEEPIITSPFMDPLQSFAMSVLLIDDQPIIAEAVKEMLIDEKDISFYYCQDPLQAVQMAVELRPTVILQDLVMPQVDGLRLVRYFKANAATKDIPLVVLSSKEEPTTKAEAFSFGANDYLVKLPDQLELVARIRYHSGSYVRLLERNEAYERLKESQQLLNDELNEAATYVRSLLPAPCDGPISVRWQFIPSAKLGGDAFGYQWLDEDHFAFYLFDVCGHGTGAALLSISIMNLLSAKTLPHVDFCNPAAVLKALNSTFEMEKHNNMFFTMWYGVYDRQTEVIEYASGGHPPALLIAGEKMMPLSSEGIVVGAGLETVYKNQRQALSKEVVSDGCQLFLFSDGVYEVSGANQKLKEMMSLDELYAIFLDASRLDFEKAASAVLRQIQTYQNGQLFQDDFSLVHVKFNRR